MNKKKVLLVGCGDIGISLGLQLVNEDYEVWGIRRHADKLPVEMHGLSIDITDLASLSAIEDKIFDHVVITLTPSERTDDSYYQAYVVGLKNVLMSLVGCPFIIYISSTSVYAQHNHEWINESSVACPNSFSGKRLLEAEQLLENFHFPFTIIRFSGIYGPGRYRLIDQVSKLQGCTKEPDIFTNRIHRDDCVGFIRHLIVLHQTGQVIETIYIGSDNEPATLYEVKRFIAEQLNIDLSTLVDQLQEKRSSKRLDNKKMLATGYQLQYESFKPGYSELVSQYKK